MTTAQTVVTPRPERPLAPRRMRVVAGVLADGTPHYSPYGLVEADGDVVRCHLCGAWFRSVLAHLPKHGWDQARYRESFGLERSHPLEGSHTRRRRAAALVVRRAREPRVKAGFEAGRHWVRSGALTRAAAEAARGRRQPEQRRRKTLATLAAISPDARAAGVRRHADERLRETATAAAAALGFAGMGELVRNRVARGASLAAVSREAGLHKDWLTRHLARVDPEAAAEVRRRTFTPQDVAWLPLVEALGFADPASYLTDRHVTRHMTVAAIADEAGMTHGAVVTALRRHGIARTAHAASRSACAGRAAEVAARFGFADLDAYLADRRATGLSWRAIAAECAQPPSWVRRRAGLE